MYKLWAYISIVALLAGCSDTSISKKDIVVLGHAGAGFPSVNNHYPTNSELSITQALLSQAADGVEVDVQITADSQFVLYHDKRLESGTNDTGYISDRTWNSLKKVKRRNGGTAIYKSVGLWRLTDLISLIDSLNLDVHLSLNVQNQYEVSDQKTYNTHFINQLFFLLKEYSNRNKVIVESRDQDFVKSARLPAEINEVKLFFIGQLSEENLSNIGQYVNGFVTNYLDESESTIQNAKDAGFEIAVYGVKIRQDINPAIDLQPDYIQTDNIPLTLSYLDR